MPSPRPNPPAFRFPRRQRTTTSATARRQRVAELLLEGADAPTIAARLGCSLRTAERDIRECLPLVQQLRRDRLVQLADRLVTEAATAVVVLGQVAQDDAAAPAARVAAARALLAEARAFVETADLAERLAAVEERLATIPAPSAEAPGAPPEARALPGRPAALDRTQAAPDMLLDQTVNGGS